MNQQSPARRWKPRFTRLVIKYNLVRVGYTRKRDAPKQVGTLDIKYLYATCCQCTSIKLN